jgi:hypothetical protein
MGIEAAVCDRETLDPPGMDGFGHPLQVVFTEITQLKSVADQTAR